MMIVGQLDCLDVGIGVSGQVSSSRTRARAGINPSLSMADFAFPYSCSPHRVSGFSPPPRLRIELCGRVSAAGCADRGLIVR
jgi:hypothetical protein